MYEKLHTAILKDSAFKKKATKANPDRAHKKYRLSKIGRKARKEKANKKIQIALGEWSHIHLDWIINILYDGYGCYSMYYII